MPTPEDREIQPLSSIQPQEWDANRKARLQTIQGIVEELGGKIFWLEDLRRLMSAFTKPQIVPILDSGEEFIRLKGQELRIMAGMSEREVVRLRRGRESKFVDLTVTFNGSEHIFNCNGGFYIHTPATLRAADKLLEILTPGLNLAVDQDYSTVLDRVSKVRKDQLAIVDISTDWIEFATIVPGMSLAYFFNDINRSRRVVTVQANLSNGISRPMEAIF